MIATLAFTIGDMLWSILLALLVGAFFGRWIVRERYELWKRPTMGDLMARLSQLRGAQVIRSMGLSKARAEGNDIKGRLRDYDPKAEQSGDAETHSEN